METETARLVVIGATALGSVAWMAGLLVLVRTGRGLRAAAGGETTRYVVEEGEVASVVGEAEVEGEAEAVSIKLAGLLARDGSGPFGAVKILARDRRELAFESVGPSPLGFRRGRVRFTSAGPRTRIDYALETTRRAQLMLGIGWAIQALGLAVLVGVPTLMFAAVIPSPSPNVRGQAMQVIQMAHALWPPFLFAHLARLPSRLFRARMDSLIHNLPYA